jgi:hypothetical protein
MYSLFLGLTYNIHFCFFISKERKRERGKDRGL